MSDVHDDGGDLPDTFDDRLAGIARLIDTLGAEQDPARRLLRRLVIVRLLTRLELDALDGIAVLLDRIGDDG